VYACFVWQATGVDFDSDMEDRLCAYSRAVAHFPTAVKEFEVYVYKYWYFTLYAV
jgi:hypothetical protein